MNNRTMQIGRVSMAAWLLVALWSVGAFAASAPPKAVVLAWNDGGLTAKALRDAGFDAAVPPQAALASVDLSGVRLVVVSADTALPDSLAGRISLMVRGGGGLLVVHTAGDNPNYWWETYRRVNRAQPNPSPLWDAFAFTQVPSSDQKNSGIRNPFGPTRILYQAQSPVLSGVDLKLAPLFPYHTLMVLPTHPLVQGAHQMFGWSEDQYKSPLWGNGQVLAWGDDPEQRPLLLTAEYGAGRCAAAAVPLFNSQLLQWPGGRVLLSNLTTWLTGGEAAAGTTAADAPAVYGIDLPWLVQDSLRRMGWRIAARPEGTSGAIVYGAVTNDQAQALAAMAKAGKPVVLASPAALGVEPLRTMAAALPAAAPAVAGPVAAAPRVIVDEKTAQSGKLMRDGLWALDSGDVAKAQGWFTPEGSAHAKWTQNFPREQASPKPAVAAPAADVPGVAVWSKSYRWRLEGNLLDRRDFVEGWDRPGYDDRAWAEQRLGQNPPSPKVLGQQPGQNLLAGALWARTKLTLVNPQASHQWLTPAPIPQVVTLLDGKPLRQKVEVRKLSAGEHAVALRIWPTHPAPADSNEDPWGKAAGALPWPQVAAEPVAVTAEAKGKIWYKTTLQLPAGSHWNALQVGQFSAAALYINGKQICSGAGGTFSAPWHTGENLVVFGDVSEAKIPGIELVQAPEAPAPVNVPAAKRLCGVWYRRDNAAHEALAQGWPAALTGQTSPAGWVPAIADADAGTVGGVASERSQWFAAPFLVSASEAAGPARLVINTTGGAVPTDLIKILWVNGQPVPARIEFVSTQRYDLQIPEETKKAGGNPKGGKAKGGKSAAKENAPEDDEAMADDKAAADQTEGAAPLSTVRGEGEIKQTTICFVLSGKLKAGTNWLAFPVDMQNLYGLRMAVPAGLGWNVPLPKLDFSGKVDAITWTEPLGRLASPGLIHRGPLVTPPPQATVLARFSDGAPAVARVGNITFATSDQSRDWSRWIEESVRVDWLITRQDASTYGDPLGMKQVNHASGDPVQADGAQIASTLLHPSLAILSTEPSADGSTALRLAPADKPRLLNYQLRNWTGMLLAEGRLPVPAGAQRVVVPAPAPAGDPSPLTTQLRADRWLRAALLENGGASISDYLEARVDFRPSVEVLLSPTDGLQRDLPARIPGSPSYDARNLNWSLNAESPADPVVVPGERIRLRVMCRNTTDKPQPVALELAWEGALENKPVALPTLRFTLAPYEQRTEVLPCGFAVADMRFVSLPGNDLAPLRTLPQGQQPTGDFAAGRIVARGADGQASELALIAVRPWKQFAPYSEPLPGQHGAPGGFTMAQFGLTPTLDSISDPPGVFWNSPYGGNWYSAIDWWRDHLVDTRGTGGGFGGYQGKEDFAWGPYDEPYIVKNAALDNASYLPDGTQYEEYLYSGITREYNRFLKGQQPLHMEVADYWASGATPKRERNVAQFLRWRAAQGRPLVISTVDEFKQRFDEDAAVREDWLAFSRDAYVGWSAQFMAAMPPGSVSSGQGETDSFRFYRLHDDLQAYRAVLEGRNSGIQQPPKIGRRGELIFADARAIAPGYVLPDNKWHGVTGNPQLEQHAVFCTPEFVRLTYLDYGLTAIRDDQGRCQPCINVSPAFDKPRGYVLFAEEGPGVNLPAEAPARDVTSHLDHLIQPEHVLGAYVMPSLERAAKNKLQGSTVYAGGQASEKQPELVLAHMLRNYGALWGGSVASDRVDKLQPGEGAIYLMPSGAGDAEAKPLADFVRRGGHLSTFFSTGGTQTQETALSDLFGVKYAPLPAGVRGGMLLPGQPERPLTVFGENLPQYIATRPGNDPVQGTGGFANRVLLRQVEAGKGRATFSAFNGDLSWGWDHDLARQLAKAVNWAAGNPVTLPDGVGGYAFEAKGLIFLVLEDLKYTGGEAAIHVKLPAGKYLAADVFSGRPVKAEAREDDVILYPTLLPNGGSLIVLRKL